MSKEKVKSAITKIEIDDATFHGEEINPTLINFFYGRNGAGKSTIARAVESGTGITWGNGHLPSEYDVLVYSQDYIDANFSNVDNLPGVFMVAEENIKVQEEIDKKEKERSAIEIETQQNREQKEKRAEDAVALWANFQEACWKIFEPFKKDYPEAVKGKMQKKLFAEEILGYSPAVKHQESELKALYDIAYDSSSRVYPEFKKVDHASSFGSMPGRELLDRAIISSSDTEFARFMNAINASDWVRQGHKHYSEEAKGKCPYCQQTLPSTFEKDIADSFDEQYQNDIKELESFISSYAIEMAGIVSVLEGNLDDVLPALGTQLDEYRDKIALLKSRIEVNTQRLAEKKNEPTKTVSLEDTDSLLIEIGNLIDGFNKQIKGNNDVVNSRQDKKRECKENVWQHLAFKLKGEIDGYKASKLTIEKDVTDLEAKINAAGKSVAALRREIGELSKQVVNTSAAIEGINLMLKDAGFQGFYLREKSGVPNVYEVIRENGEIAEHLSEGERNFIAFLYFYHRVSGSDNGDEMKKKIVVIDDPVSSMDSGALFLVSALVRNMIKNCSNNADYEADGMEGTDIKQIFILTHNVYFHNAVTNDQVRHYSWVSFYMVRKVDNISTVDLQEDKTDRGDTVNKNPVQNSYAALWDELDDLDSPIPVMNVIRQILDYYFLELCGYDGKYIREQVLENEESKKRLITPSETGGKPDMLKHTLAVSMLNHISNNQLGDGLHYVEECSDADQYKEVLRLIFEAMGQDQHYRKMRKEEMRVS